MKKPLIGVVYFILSSLLILSGGCEEGSTYFLDLEQEITFLTLSGGEYLSYGDEIPLEMEYNSSAVNPDMVVVAYLSADKENLGQIVLDGEFETSEDLQSIIIPEELEPGGYYLEINVYEADSLVHSETIPFFVIDDNFSIDSLNIFPPQTVASGTVIATVDYTSPDRFDPFIRWTLKDRIILEGLASEGADSLVFQAPDTEGLHSLKCEIWPEKLSGQIVSVTSGTVEITVSDVISPDRFSLDPEEDYSLLLHFSGQMTNRGTAGADIEQPDIIGSPQPAVINGRFQYVFTSADGLLFSENPLTIINGNVMPFVLTGHVTFDSVDEGNLLLIEDIDGGASIEYVLADSRLSVSMNSGDVSSFSEMDVDLVIDKPYWITLLCLPEEDSIRWYWFLDGEFVSRDLSSYAPVSWSGNSRAVFGAESDTVGFSGAVDEFGIRVMNLESLFGQSDSLHKDVYSLAYGDRLLYSESFNKWPAAFPFAEDQERIYGVLDLTENDFFRINVDNLLSSRPTAFLGQWSGNAEDIQSLRIDFENSENELLFSIFPNQNILLDASDSSYPLNLDGIFRWVVSPQEGGLVISAGSEDNVVELPIDIGEISDVVISHSDSEKIFSMENLLIFNP